MRAEIFQAGCVGLLASCSLALANHPFGKLPVANAVDVDRPFPRGLTALLNDPVGFRSDSAISERFGSTIPLPRQMLLR
jgi:hypothetical protein